MANIKKMLTEAEAITDPDEREKKIADIIQLMIGTSPARAAVEPVIPPPTGAVESLPPKPEDLQMLQVEAAKSGRGPRKAAAYTDEELAEIINHPNKALVDPEGMAEAELKERAAIDKEPALDKLLHPNYLNRLASNVVASSGEMLSSGPLILGGLATKIPEYVTGKDLGSDEMMAAASKTSQDIRDAVGITQPRDIGESMAGILPNLVPLPVKAPTSLLGNAAELVTPFVIGGGAKRVLANFVTAGVAEQGLREVADEAGDPYKTATDQLGITGGLIPDLSFPRVAEGIGVGLAGMGLATLGLPVFAKSLRTRQQANPTLPTPVKDIDIHGPENLKTLERSGDLFKTYFTDSKQVLIDLAKRAGVPNLTEISDLVDGNTQMTALMRVNEAMRTGALRTKSGDFSVNITPDQLNQSYKTLDPQKQTDVDMYVKLHDLKDVLQIQVNNNKNVGANVAKIIKARRDIADIEARVPEARQYLDQYTHITGAVRDFLGSGPGSMLTSKRKAELERTRRHFVPSDVLGVDPNGNVLERIVDATQPIDQRTMDNWYRMNPDQLVDNVNVRANSFEMLNDFTRNALKAKMEHDVRNVYATGILNSAVGNETMRPASKTEIKQYPSRIVTLWQDGKRKNYITTKLTRQLLQFDPYVAKYPDLFSLKRLFEYGTTGPGSVVFAPMTLMRDSLGGWITKEKDMLSANPLEVLTAVPEQVWAKTKLAAVDMLQSNISKIPFIDNAARPQIADQIGNSYMNSLYHLSNESGGTDASLMKHNVEVSKGALREAGKSIQAAGGKVPGMKTLGRSLHAMLRGWENLFDAVSEAPRYATFKKNVKAGMDPVEAATRSRRITGDATRSGVVYNNRGQRIDADAQNKSLKVLAGTLGAATEVVRETVPYFNPMVQGLRRLGNRMIDDPLGVNLRAWTSVGLPTVAALGWNEMLGEEYNRYSFEQRSSRDIAMNMYIGIPGLPPEQGLQIPIPHEFTLYGSPFATGLYSLMRGDATEDAKAMMMHQAGASLENASMVGFPQWGTAAMAVMGQKAPESIMDPWNWEDETRTISENNVGVLPENWEIVTRNLFGGIADTVGMSAAAVYESGNPVDFFDELGYQFGKKTPIVKNLIGATSPVSVFTPDSELAYKETKAVDKFMEIYDEHFGRPESLLRERALPKLNGAEYQDTDITTMARMGRNPSPTPTNPIFRDYGPEIKSRLDSNDEGYSALSQRSNLYRDQVRNLKTYTAGSKDGFKRWQENVHNMDEEYQKALAEYKEREPTLSEKQAKDELKGIEMELGERAKLDRLLKEQKLDLSKRSDVQKMIGLLEMERIKIRKTQRTMIKATEDWVTQDMIQKGIIQPGMKFDVTKHLGINTPSDLAQ